MSVIDVTKDLDALTMTMTAEFAALHGAEQVGEVMRSGARRRHRAAAWRGRSGR